MELPTREDSAPGGPEHIDTVGVRGSKPLPRTTLIPLGNRHLRSREDFLFRALSHFFGSHGTGSSRSSCTSIFPTNTASAAASFSYRFENGLIQSIDIFCNAFSNCQQPTPVNSNVMVVNEICSASRSSVRSSEANTKCV